MTLISLKLWQNFIKRGCPVIALLSRGCLQSTGFWPGNPFIVEHISAYWLIVGYLISVSCIKHRRNDLQLFRPHSKLQWLTEKEKEQVILQQLDKDPSKGQGSQLSKITLPTTRVFNYCVTLYLALCTFTMQMCFLLLNQDPPCTNWCSWEVVRWWPWQTLQDRLPNIGCCQW